MREYIPSPSPRVAEQVELYEKSGGREGTTLDGLPVIIVSNQGRKTHAVRKTPLMRVVDGSHYILVASLGGAPTNPLWYHNIKSDPNVKFRDRSKIYHMRVREVTNTNERQRLWSIAVKAFPPYKNYQESTDRMIPLLVAEPTD